MHIMNFAVFNELWGIKKELTDIGEDIYKEIKSDFDKIDALSGNNQLRVISYFQNFGLSQEHFFGSTGYGYGDAGRELINDVMAKIMQTESAIVSSYWVSGTHVISDCLNAILDSGDLLVSAVGSPYETLNKVIEKWKVRKGIKFEEVGLEYKDKEAPTIDFHGLNEKLKEKPRALFVQKSKGYSWRKTLLNNEIKNIVELRNEISPETYVFVDNCYGEFVEEIEPGRVGADLLAGSLIKNPGGGIAPTGGYAAGNEALVELVGEELTAPGLGADMGATLDTNRDIIQGLYFAPVVVGEALKGAVFNAAFFNELGYNILPGVSWNRGDIIQAINLGDEEKLKSFVEGIQKAGVVDSNVVPIPEKMPGYESEVIMAAGTFIQGASSELSADAPLKPPYYVFFQGGLTLNHSILGTLMGAQYSF